MSFDRSAVMQNNNDNEAKMSDDMLGGREELKCVISHEVMQNPVITCCCSNSFELQSLKEWVDQRGPRATCPTCRAPSFKWIPNRALKESIERFHQEEKLRSEQNQVIQHLKAENEELTNTTAQLVDLIEVGDSRPAVVQKEWLEELSLNNKINHLQHEIIKNHFQSAYQKLKIIKASKTFSLLLQKYQNWRNRTQAHLQDDKKNIAELSERLELRELFESNQENEEKYGSAYQRLNDTVLTATQRWIDAKSSLQKTREEIRRHTYNAMGEIGKLLVIQNRISKLNPQLHALRKQKIELHDSVVRTEKAKLGLFSGFNKVQQRVDRELVLAVQQGSYAKAKTLLQHKNADPNVFSLRAQITPTLQPIFIAILQSDMVMINLLMEFNASLDCYNQKEISLDVQAVKNYFPPGTITPFIVSIIRYCTGSGFGQMTAIEQFVKKDPRVLAQADKFRRDTGLHWAVYLDNLMMVKSLIEWGADISALNAENKTPAMCASSYSVIRDVLEKARHPVYIPRL